MSVRFLGRRVYLSLAVVLASARLAGQRPTVARLSDELNIPMRTLERWRQWWRQQFPLTPLWRAQCARFMPPVDTALAEGIAALGAKPVLHGDNGATLKATTVLAMLNWLGVKPSYSRPRVSDDNAYAEALFRTAKYRPEFPAQGFADLDQARTWAAGFVHWYNVEHRHSGIRYVSPAQRHAGDDQAILAARHALYLQARQLNPARWSGGTRNWAHIAAVTLNPERDSVIKAQLAEHDIQPLAA